MMKALVFLAPGFEEIEAMTIVDLLRRGGVEVVTAGLETPVEGSHGVKVLPDKKLEEVRVEEFDAVICPGGYPGYENLKKNQRVLEMVKEAAQRNKIVAAICGAPSVLAEAGVLKGKKGTIYPGMEAELKKAGGKPSKGLVVVDGKVITSMGPATAFAFALELLKRLAGRKKAEEVKKATLAHLGAKLR
ncbi:MAG: DJ-1 family protein [Hadesarchaea archaeon]|nr:MAG: DJ-1 family protein [Hadesarchaea archaeon]TDA33491.1 MAG: DJ-1 family protein [Hadesarchaea archaeon]